MIAPAARIYRVPDIAALARHGIVSLDATRSARISRRRWQAAHDSGELVRMHPGVSRLADAAQTEEQRILAAVLSCGPTALASHRSAAYLWQAPGSVPAPSVVEVVVPHVRRIRPRSDVVVHRTTAEDDLAPSNWRGIPCTSPLRTLVDLGSVDPEMLQPTFDALLVARLVSRSAIEALLERHARQGRRGVAALRAIADDWPFDLAPDSALEIEISRVLRRESISGFEFHPILAGFEVDFAHRRSRLVIEGDGFEFHSSREAFERDRGRDLVLATEGWHVVRVTWSAVRNEPVALAGRLRALIAQRGDSYPRKA